MEKIDLTEEIAEEYNILLSQLRKGDQKAISLIFNHYYHELVSYSESITNNRAVAKEIAADSFMQVWKNKDRFPSIKSLQSFVFICARNSAFNYLKAEKRKYKKEESFKYLSVAPPDPDDMITPQHVKAFYEALETLPVQQKEILKMYIDGKTTREISQSLSTTIKNVQNQRLKAKHNLQEKLSKTFLQLNRLIPILSPFVAVSAFFKKII